MPTQNSAKSTTLNVSLEQHLISTLKLVRDLLPKELNDELEEYVTEPPPAIIPYQLLRKVSEWSRTPSGKERLHEKSIPYQDYDMVALLAGSTTSPEKSFGEYIPPPEPEVIAAKRAGERKQIAALVNSLFSVFGAGFAAWWGADRTGWKDEYKVLFGLLVGIVVAISEGVLFLIWSSRTKAPRKKRYNALHKKDHDDEAHEKQEDTPVANASDDENSGLRQRRQ